MAALRHFPFRFERSFCVPYGTVPRFGYPTILYQRRFACVPIWLLVIINNVQFPKVFRIRTGILFSRIRIRIQRLRLETNTDPDPDPIRIQGFNDQKFKKITAEKKVKFFFIKNCNLRIPRPP
jgi:hypothetical protein